jgi:hypothetical protein
MELVDAHHRDQAGRTPLHYAAVDNKLNDVNALIAAGAEIDAREDTGQYTPLMFAAQNDDNIEVVKALVEAGADVNLTNRKGETPLSLRRRRRATTAPGAQKSSAIFSIAPRIRISQKRTATPRFLMSSELKTNSADALHLAHCSMNDPAHLCTHALHRSGRLN